MQRFVARILLSLATLTCSEATVLYSSFVPACCSGYTVSGASSSAGGAFSAAMGFTPSVSAILTQIDVSLTWTSGTNSGPVLTLKSDSGGLPGPVLMSWNLSGGLASFVANGACCSAIESVTPSSTLSLFAGTQYWLVASAGAADTWDDWVVGGVSGAPVATTQVAGGPLVRITDQEAGFDVIGAPEPASVTLVGVALGWILILFHRGYLRPRRPRL